VWLDVSRRGIGLRAWALRDPRTQIRNAPFWLTHGRKCSPRFSPFAVPFLRSSRGAKLNPLCSTYPLHNTPVAQPRPRPARNLDLPILTQISPSLPARVPPESPQCFANGQREGGPGTARRRRHFAALSASPALLGVSYSRSSPRNALASVAWSRRLRVVHLSLCRLSATFALRGNEPRMVLFWCFRVQVCGSGPGKRELG
jgi:hypothetical protein